MYIIIIGIEELSRSVLESDPNPPDRIDVLHVLSGKDIDDLVQSLNDATCETNLCDVVCETDLSGSSIYKLEKEVEEMRLNMHDLRNHVEQLKKDLDV